MDTAKDLIIAYPWYYLPGTVHEILIHDSAVRACINFDWRAFGRSCRIQ